MQEGKLTRVWIQVEASLPLEWTLIGVVREPLSADPQIPSDNWVAFAVGPEGERAEGVGTAAVSALTNLAHQLTELRRDPNGWHALAVGMGQPRPVAGVRHHRVLEATAHVPS